MNRKKIKVYQFKEKNSNLKNVFINLILRLIIDFLKTTGYFKAYDFSIAKIKKVKSLYIRNKLISNIQI